MTESFRGVLEDPAVLGALLALIYTVASFAQLVVGNVATVDTIACQEGLVER